MPIRFRCAYCNQLMGIARRKAGTVVRCPRCTGELIVPATPDAQPAGAAGRLNLFFEGDDFGNDFAEVKPIREEAPAPFPHAPRTEAEPRAEPPPATSDAAPVRDLRRRGIFLPMPAVAAASALVLGAIGLTFVLGFFLGRLSVP
jgi:hypothetical protein